DPSVVDESDPVASDPRLDMYDARNGYRPMGEGPSSYTAEFLAAFRAAQRERCERLDARAVEWCDAVRWYRRRLGAADDASPAERALLARHALQRRYFLIYRTLADPRYLDPRLHPSQRPLGSIFSFGRDPVVGNYGEGLARTMSARGWLSTWSGLRSKAALARTMPGIAVPTLVVCAMADLDIYPTECRLSFDRSGARDKQWAALARAITCTRRARGGRIFGPRRCGGGTRSPGRGCASAGPPSLHRRAGLSRAPTRRRRRHRPVRLCQAARNDRGRGGGGRHPRRARRRGARARRRRRALPLRHRIDRRRRRRGGAGAPQRPLLLDAQPRRRGVLRGDAARRGGPGGRSRVGRPHVPRPQPRPPLVLRRGIHGGRTAVGEDRGTDSRLLPVAGAVRDRVAPPGDGAHRPPAHGGSRHHRRPPRRAGAGRAPPPRPPPPRAHAGAT